MAAEYHVVPFVASIGLAQGAQEAASQLQQLIQSQSGLGVCPARKRDHLRFRQSWLFRLRGDRKPHHHVLDGGVPAVTRAFKWLIEIYWAWVPADRPLLVPVSRILLPACLERAR